MALENSTRAPNWILKTGMPGIKRGLPYRTCNAMGVAYILRQHPDNTWFKKSIPETELFIHQDKHQVQ